MTLADFLRHATAALAGSSPSPRLDAEVLAMHVTGLTRTQLITHADDPLTPGDQSQLERLLARRARGEPVAYLTGRREFWSMEFTVTPDVLIPRPETELLVEQALARIPADAGWIIADLGTGSGAVAIAIARERPGCRVLAIDASSAALAVARANAQRLGIGNVEFRHGDWLAPLAGERLDMLVSNPPYIATGDPHLEQGDVRFEPHAALAGGVDGLAAIRLLAAGAGAHLKPGGWLLLEHGHAQAGAVRKLLSECGLRAACSYRDLAGNERVTGGHQPA